MVFSPGDVGHAQKHFWWSQLVVVAGLCVLPSSSGQRPEMLLHPLQCTERSPHKEQKFCLKAGQRHNKVSSDGRTMRAAPQNRTNAWQCNLLTGRSGRSGTDDPAGCRYRTPVTVLFNSIARILLIDKTQGQRIQQHQGSCDQGWLMIDTIISSLFISVVTPFRLLLTKI